MQCRWIIYDFDLQTINNLQLQKLHLNYQLFKRVFLVLFTKHIF